ncbi:protein saal1 [Diachasma alloeum]|uniref:protein saal1 n=1 Tax=Diachasma alloeum TaxID=454923 RepID=UPI000738243E|nr:protein saal1 [Diachasma alloeum]
MESAEEQGEGDNGLSSTIVEPGDVDEDEMNTMRGDTVGETAYSGSWILKTLISLSKLPEEVKWSTDIEEDLCYLWDMTAEKDVVSFMIENQFLSIAEHVLDNSTEERLTEIIVGITGNLCCQSDILSRVAENSELVDSLLSILLSNDTETLIQVLRILQAAVWNLQSENWSSKWLESLKQCKFLGDSLIFILKSSTNENLVIATLTLLQSITAIETENSLLFKETFDMKSLLPALVEAFSQLIPQRSSDEIHSSKELKVIENWLEILSKILEVSSPNVRDVIENDGAVVNSLMRILEPYKTPENLKMIAMEEPQIIDCIHQTIELIEWFQKSRFDVDVTVVSIVLEIMYQLHILTSSNFNETGENLRVKELRKYLETYWIKLQSPGGLNISELLELSSAETKHYLINNF